MVEIEIRKDNLDTLPDIPNEVVSAMRLGWIWLRIMGGLKSPIPPMLARNYGRTLGNFNTSIINYT